MNNGWTPERRARQAALIRSWKPWERSTGPRTESGKAAASMNRECSLQAARHEVEQARRKLMAAQSRLEALGVKSTLDIPGILALMKSF